MQRFSGRAHIIWDWWANCVLEDEFEYLVFILPPDEEMLFLSWTQSLSFSTVYITHICIRSSDASSAHSSFRGPNGSNPHYHVFLNFLCSVAQSCPTLCNATDCSTPGFPVLHHLLELAQSHVHWWCHPTILSFVFPFSCLQSFPASRSFLMSRLFASGGQSIGASASASVLPINIQDWYPLGLIYTR